MKRNIPCLPASSIFFSFLKAMSLKIDTGALSHLAAIHGYQKNCLSSGKISSAHIWTDNLCAKDDKKKDIFI